MSKKIWLDCDPGHDDAMAIVLALFHPDLELIGISTVAGNQAIEKVTNNVASILFALKKNEIPLIQGMGKPLLGQFPYCEEIHGSSGLDNLDGKPVFQPVVWKQTHSLWLTAIYEMIKSHWEANGQKIHWVSTGSLTNLALLLTLFPELASWIDITFMGGALGIGNTHPVAEFNIENDPEAAQIVLNSGISVCMIPLEVTHSVLVTPEVEQQIGRNSAFRQQILMLLSFFKETYKKVFDFDFPPLHDPVAVFWLIKPAAFSGKLMHVAVETSAGLCRGQTVCDYYGRSGKHQNVWVQLSVDTEAFWSSMLLAIDRAEKHIILHKKI